MAVFIVFWISPAVNSIKSFKYLAEKGYCWFLEPFALLFMQLEGQGCAGDSAVVVSARKHVMT